MDYARFNYVAARRWVTALFPRIGDYDKWAIKWGIPILKTLKTRHRKSVVEQND
jgi:hypothetical protein